MVDDICNSLVIPALTCCDNAKFNASRLPLTLPRETSAESLQTLYNFKAATQLADFVDLGDLALQWSACIIRVSDGWSSYGCTKLETQYCDTENANDGNILNTRNNNYNYVGLYGQMVDCAPLPDSSGGVETIAQNCISERGWIKRGLELCCVTSEEDPRRGCLLYAPAPAPAPVPQILPTPTFVPKRRGFTTPKIPEYVCSEPTLVYDEETGEMRWDVPSNNCVMIYNASRDKKIPAKSAVSLIARVTDESILEDLRKGGLPNDRICYTANMAKEDTKDDDTRVMGIADCDIEPLDLGLAFIVGAVEAVLPTNVETGDRISIDKDSSTGWKLDPQGSTVVVAAGRQKLVGGSYKNVGTVLLGQAATRKEVQGYQGYFCVSDASRDGKHIIHVRGGETDIGWVEDAELEITEDCEIELVAQYLPDDLGGGDYLFHFSTDVYSDENIVTEYFGNWLIASIYLTDEGKLGIIQQWQNGAIYFGSRYWVK